MISNTVFITVKQVYKELIIMFQLPQTLWMIGFSRLNFCLKSFLSMPLYPKKFVLDIIYRNPAAFAELGVSISGYILIKILENLSKF